MSTKKPVPAVQVFCCMLLREKPLKNIQSGFYKEPLTAAALYLFTLQHLYFKR